MNRLLGLLLLGCLAFWAVAAALIYRYWDRLDLPEVAFPRDVALLFHSVSLGLCLLPMAVTLVWLCRAEQKKPDEQILALLGGTGLRMFFVLGVGLLLTTAVPLFAQHQTAFWLWVFVVYLGTLSLEIVIVVRHRDSLEARRKI